jgi:hypothetical protein
LVQMHSATKKSIRKTNETLNPALLLTVLSLETFQWSTLQTNTRFTLKVVGNLWAKC